MSSVTSLLLAQATDTPQPDQLQATTAATATHSPLKSSMSNQNLGGNCEVQNLVAPQFGQTSLNPLIFYIPVFNRFAFFSYLNFYPKPVQLQFWYPHFPQTNSTNQTGLKYHSNRFDFVSVWCVILCLMSS